VWAQEWLDVVFLHWAVPAERLAGLVPAPLRVEEFEGSAWVSLVVFRLRVRPRWLPFVPGVSDLLEVNLRTYVRLGDEPGIWLLRALADNRWALWLARLLTPMPYEHARVRRRRQGGTDLIHARCAGPRPSGLTLACSASSPGGEAGPGTLDEWLVERYRLYARGAGGRIVQGDGSHPPWRVARTSDVSVAENTLGGALDLARKPDLAHTSEGVTARFGAFVPSEVGRGPLLLAGTPGVARSVRGAAAWPR